MVTNFNYKKIGVKNNEINKEQIKKKKRQNYYTKNKDKIKEQAKKYYTDNKKNKKEYNKIYYENNKQKRKEYSKRKYKDNKQKYREKALKYYNDNKPKFKEYSKEYYIKNKDKIKKRSKEYYKNKNSPLYNLNLLSKESEKRYEEEENKKYFDTYEYVMNKKIEERRKLPDYDTDDTISVRSDEVNEAMELSAYNRPPGGEPLNIIQRSGVRVNDVVNILTEDDVNLDEFIVNLVNEDRIQISKEGEPTYNIVYNMIRSLEIIGYTIPMIREEDIADQLDATIREENLDLSAKNIKPGKYTPSEIFFRGRRRQPKEDYIVLPRKYEPIDTYSDDEFESESDEYSDDFEEDYSSDEFEEDEEETVPYKVKEYLKEAYVGLNRKQKNLIDMVYRSEPQLLTWSVVREVQKGGNKNNALKNLKREFLDANDRDQINYSNDFNLGAKNEFDDFMNSVDLGVKDRLKKIKEEDELRASGYYDEEDLDWPGL